MSCKQNCSITKPAWALVTPQLTQGQQHWTPPIIPLPISSQHAFIHQLCPLWHAISLHAQCDSLTVPAGFCTQLRVCALIPGGSGLG